MKRIIPTILVSFVMTEITGSILRSFGVTSLSIFFILVFIATAVPAFMIVHALGACPVQEHEQQIVIQRRGSRITITME